MYVKATFSLSEYDEVEIREAWFKYSPNFYGHLDRYGDFISKFSGKDVRLMKIETL